MTGGIKTLMSECCGMIGKTKKKRRIEKVRKYSCSNGNLATGCMLIKIIHFILVICL